MEAVLDAVLFGMIIAGVGGISLGAFIYFKDKRDEKE